jgi:hypothetical protein
MNIKHFQCSLCRRQGQFQLEVFNFLQSEHQIHTQFGLAGRKVMSEDDLYKIIGILKVLLTFCFNRFTFLSQGF